MKRLWLGLAFVCLLAPLASVNAAPSWGLQTLSGTVFGRVVVPRYTLLQGVGEAKIVGNVLLNEGSGIDGVEVTGWEDATWNYSAGVMILGNNALVRNCYIHDGPSHGIQVIGGRTGATIIGNRIEHVGDWSMSGSDEYPMAAWRGISLERGSDGAVISGNQIVDPWEGAIFEHRSPGVVIRGNWIIRPNRGRVDQWNAGSGNGIESLSQNAVIDSNFIEGETQVGEYAGRHGIYVSGENSIVTGNTIQAMARGGIMALGSADGRIITNNSITDVGGFGPNEAGIRVFVYEGGDPARGTLIHGNRISQVHSGVAVRTGNGALVADTLVTGNVLNGLRLQLEGENDLAVANL